jgi:hypothetical protein
VGRQAHSMCDEVAKRRQDIINYLVRESYKLDSLLCIQYAYGKTPIFMKRSGPLARVSILANSCAPGEAQEWQIEVVKAVSSTRWMDYVGSAFAINRNLDQNIINSLNQFGPTGFGEEATLEAIYNSDLIICNELPLIDYYLSQTKSAPITILAVHNDGMRSRAVLDTAPSHSMVAASCEEAAAIVPEGLGEARLIKRVQPYPPAQLPAGGSPNFGIDRFQNDWLQFLAEIISKIKFVDARRKPQHSSAYYDTLKKVEACPERGKRIGCGCNQSWECNLSKGKTRANPNHVILQECITCKLESIS